MGRAHRGDVRVVYGILAAVNFGWTLTVASIGQRTRFEIKQADERVALGGVGRRWWVRARPERARRTS